MSVKTKVRTNEDRQRLAAVLLQNISDCIGRVGGNSHPTVSQRPCRLQNTPKNQTVGLGIPRHHTTSASQPGRYRFSSRQNIGSVRHTLAAREKGMPERYRLFFRFASNPIQIIIYVWFNDENTLRKAGAKTDVYETFKRMLARGEVPGSIEELLFASG